MELISAKSQIDRSRPEFLLDENIPVPKNTIISRKYLPLREFAKQGTPDWLLLELAKEAELTIITRDKGLVIRALSEKQDIIHEDNYGNRFYFHGKNTYQFKETTKYVAGFWQKIRKLKKSEKLSSMRTRTVSLSGFEKIFCL